MPSYIIHKLIPSYRYSFAFASVIFVAELKLTERPEKKLSNEIKHYRKWKYNRIISVNQKRAHKTMFINY